jgi:hypothetical protein
MLSWCDRRRLKAVWWLAVRSKDEDGNEDDKQYEEQDYPALDACRYHRYRNYLYYPKGKGLKAVQVWTFAA